MKRSNVNPCPHTDAHAHTIRTSDGRTASTTEAEYARHAGLIMGLIIFMMPRK